MKKVLILTVTAGNGHNACAKAMSDKLTSMGNVEVKIVDIIKEYSTPLTFWTVDSGYNISVSKLLPIYNMCYEMYKRRNPELRYKNMAQTTAISCLQGLLKEIYTFQPDVIFCTHFYAGIAISDLRLKYDIPCKTYITSLDYVNSPFWESSIGVDYFNLPNEDFVEESIEEGFKREQLLTFGLPVKDKFYEVTDKSKAKKELGLDPEIFTVLIMFGGGHWGGGFKLFKDLISSFSDRTLQVIMINGKNKASYEKVAKTSIPDNIKVINVGFTDKVDMYMSASDVAINKLGGTSATEMINKRLPMLVTTKLPAQEKHNLNYLTQKGVTIPFKNKTQLKERLGNLIDNPEKITEMVANFDPLRRDSINKLAKMMLSEDNADYSDINIKAIDYSAVKKIIKKSVKEKHKNRKNIK